MDVPARGIGSRADMDMALGARGPPSRCIALKRSSTCVGSKGAAGSGGGGEPSPGGGASTGTLRFACSVIAAARRQPPSVYARDAKLEMSATGAGEIGAGGGEGAAVSASRGASSTVSTIDDHRKKTRGYM
jgi:hypothetical protein